MDPGFLAESHNAQVFSMNKIIQFEQSQILCTIYESDVHENEAVYQRRDGGGCQSQREVDWRE